jgi:ABC-type transporter lipoprotein component MlaA/pimeloyl-ACP methyl ester carboxylesterase
MNDRRRWLLLTLLAAAARAIRTGAIGRSKRLSILFFFLLLSVCPVVFGQGQESRSNTNVIGKDKVVLPPSVPDPIEPINRAMWGFNKGLMKGVIKPTSKVYRFVVIKPIRTGIDNMGRNVTYPARLMNNLFQRKWTGARDETYRFLCNSTVGIGGFFDPATKWKISKSDADFGQTLGQWGWKPHCYLMLPIFGPSNERDAFGLTVDTAANPLLYISPYHVHENNPLTYFGPYNYFSYAVTYNHLADNVEDYVRFAEAEMDPYSEIQYAWTFVRKNRVANFQVKGKQDEASLETLESVFFSYKDPEFPSRADTESVLIPKTGKELKFTFWLQKGKAPVVYIVPGLGSHRLAQSSIALAELVYRNGYSAVCVSSAFNSEFMEHALTAALPGYIPADGHDLHVALTRIDRRLRTLYPNRLGNKALMGYSMGALHSLFLASTESTNQSPLIKFDRYVALNSPVQVSHGLTKLDEFYDAPLEWKGAERTDNIENTFLKVAALSKSKVSPQMSLPFSAVESKFLIGLTFRLILRDIIFSSQRRNDQGVLQQNISNRRRHSVYQEILQYNYQDYFEKFVIPYYQTHGLPSGTAETLRKAGDLRSYEAGLRANPNVRIIVNENDFLLPSEDLAWLRSTFRPEQLTVFEQGGHLGNLANPSVQKTILKALGDLNSTGRVAK